MTCLDQILQRRLEVLARQGLRREVRTWSLDGETCRRRDAAGRVFLEFASNDYLGLSRHRDVRAAAVEAVRTGGAGAGAARLITGSLTWHEALERELAAFKGRPAALSFATGHATAVGTIPALVGPGDFVLLDRLAHACLVDGARLSGARLRVWRHNDTEDLARLLRWTSALRADTPAVVGSEEAGRGTGRVLVVTESVFSMDGDTAPLREVVSCRDALAPEAWLLVDEAHATGVLGPGGRGWIEELGLGNAIEVAMGTLGKAVGASGGFVVGSTLLREYLLHSARSFLFSTAPGPAAVAAAAAGLRILGSPEGDRLRTRLRERIAQLHSGLVRLGWELPTPASPILPLRVGSEDRAQALSLALREEGLLVPAIRYPTVRRGSARLRLTVSALHEPGDVDLLLRGLARALRAVGVDPAGPNAD